MLRFLGSLGSGKNKIQKHGCFIGSKAAEAPCRARHDTQFVKTVTNYMEEALSSFVSALSNMSKSYIVLKNSKEHKEG